MYGNLLICDCIWPIFPVMKKISVVISDPKGPNCKLADHSHSISRVYFRNHRRCWKGVLCCVHSQTWPAWQLVCQFMCVYIYIITQVERINWMSWREQCKETGFKARNRVFLYSNLSLSPDLFLIKSPDFVQYPQNPSNWVCLKKWGPPPIWIYAQWWYDD
jgi:hypothetical protein